MMDKDLIDENGACCRNISRGNFLGPIGRSVKALCTFTVILLYKLTTLADMELLREKFYLGLMPN